jgi:hypothetical protein
MFGIVAQPLCLLLFVATGVRAIELNVSSWSERSLLSARDLANIRAAKAYAEECKGSKTDVGKVHTHVYHIYEGGAGYGLQEHNAGDSIGDLSFIFPRGFDAYYKGGYIAMLHIGVTSWGKYLHCNHAPGSTTYSCQGGSYEYAGRESVSASHGGQGQGYWYSFPALGKNKQWSEMDGKSGPCMMIRIKAKCLFNKMAIAGGKCPKGCDALTVQQCSNCMVGISLTQQKQVWDDAIWNKKCPRYETEVDDELDDKIPELSTFEMSNVDPSDIIV